MHSKIRLWLWVTEAIKGRSQPHLSAEPEPLTSVTCYLPSMQCC